jgi:hypothetical protein
LGQAFTQRVPESLWSSDGVQHTISSLTLPAASVAGNAYVGPVEATLLGAALADPLGAWPASYQALASSDDDADGQPGVSSIIPTTGRSPACDLPYAPLPIPINFELTDSVYAATRSLASLNGTIVDCDTVAGALAGPAGGLPQVDGHVLGCHKTDGSSCTPAETESLDSNTANAQRMRAARFRLVRVPADITCTEVRALGLR